MYVKQKWTECEKCLCVAFSYSIEADGSPFQYGLFEFSHQKYRASWIIKC